MRRILRDLARGLVLALLVGLAAFLLARFGLGRLQAMAALLPAAMATLLLLAWLSHLREDGFFGRAPEAEARRSSTPGFASFEDEVLERPVRALWTARELRRALLWGALALGLASVALYHWGGIGARFPQ